MRRVNELLKREIAVLLERMDFRLPDTVVSITAVETSPDLRHAKVGVSVLGGGEDARRGVLRSLRKERVDIQTAIAGNVRLKYTPVLQFELDTRIESGDKILAILAEMEGDGEIPDDDLPPDTELLQSS
jgi:ribosome-binding factor A